MKNVNYLSEISSAAVWVERHLYDRDLKYLMKQLSDSVNDGSLSHDDRVLWVFEWMKKYYPGVPANICLGIVLLVEG